jgi:hypothetical protein
MRYGVLSLGIKQSDFEAIPLPLKNAWTYIITLLRARFDLRKALNRKFHLCS